MTTCEIPLTKDKVALVDPDWHDVLTAMGRWTAHTDGYNWYARRSAPRDPSTGRRSQIHMHRVILGLTDPKIEVDHINGDGLDNRRSNLRSATHAQNGRNRRRQRTYNTSGFMGVTWDKGHQKWRAYLVVNGTFLRIGDFDDSVEAARARDAAALYHYGEFARLNFPVTGLTFALS